MLVLYQAEHCGRSREVRKKLTELGLSFVAHNPRMPGDRGGEALNKETLDEMKDLGGKDQIPFLVDTRTGERLYEGRDIVEFLEDNYG